MPDYLSPEVGIQLLNTVGLAIVGKGLYMIYKTLILRSELLSKSVVDLEKAHGAVVSTMEKRSAQIDSRFEDEKKFRDLYLARLEDAETHKERVEMWKQREVSILEGQVATLNTRVAELQARLGTLSEDHATLQERFKTLVERYTFIEKQNSALQVELGKSGPTVRGLA